jgi:outer membrane protein assembly factor BamB
LALLSTVLLNGQVSVLTNRYDNGRTGLNPKETFLNPANVKSTTFAKLGSFNVDGFVVAQPLYMENVSIGGTLHDVVFVATMHDSLYAFDANNLTGAPLWQQSFINPGVGITPVPIGDQGCPLVNGYNEIGIQGTPVIQPAGNGGTLYVDAKTKVVSGSNFTFVHTLYAVDITSGSVLKSAQVTGSVQGANGTVPFDSAKGCQRAGLLLSNGIVYVAFGSNGCDTSRGWVFAYDASLNQLGEFSTSPNQPRGANIWQGGAGLAADDNGNVFFLTANGPFNVNTGGSDFGDSFLKLTLSGGVLNWSDYFTPFDQANMGANDLDLGSGGAMLLSSPNVLIGAGKTGSI